MRKFYFLALLAGLILGFGTLVSCGDDDDDDDDNDDDNDDAGDEDAGDADNGSSWDDDDDLSGDLTWQDPPSDDGKTWEEAIEYCKNLSFDGHDDWRLPTISELRSLIRGCDATELGGACGVTDGCTDFDCWNDPCSGCAYLEGPGEGGAYWPDEITGAIFWYWSSSPVADIDNRAYTVSFSTGCINGLPPAYGGGDARCVRP